MDISFSVSVMVLLGLTLGNLSSQAHSAENSMEAPVAPKVVQFEENPIIRPEMLPGEDGVNICDPSLMLAPAWLEKPLGKYYLYFADHKGKYIRLAYADQLQGPWKIYEPGTLHMDEMVAHAKSATPDESEEIIGGHISSPDVHVDNEKKEIRMYFHFQLAPSKTWGHRSAVAISKDGINFQIHGSKPIGEPYMRIFQRDGYYYAINRSAAVARSKDGLTDFQVGNETFADAVGHKNLSKSNDNPDPEDKGKTKTKGKSKDKADMAPSIRHTAIKLDGDVLSLFFSRSADLPEVIMMSQADLTGDWKTWKLSPPVIVLKSEMEYEGASVPPQQPTNQEMRKLPRPMFQELRDPYIYREGGKTYLLYSVAGERGIAIAELK